MSNEAPQQEVSIEALVNTVARQEPKPKEKPWIQSMDERAEIKEVLEKCGNIRGLIVCVDDEVLLYVGRYWFNGVIKGVSKLGVVIVNQHHESAIALGKISFVTVLKRGKWYHEYCRVRGC